MRIFKLAALGAILMICSGQQSSPAHGGLLNLFGNNNGHSISGAMNPTIGAREDFEAAVADYKKCLAVKPANDCGSMHQI
jgi:hypothetical protein